MKKMKSMLIKGGMTVFLAGYLLTLYRADYAKDVPMETITAKMESFADITAMQKRGNADLQRNFKVNGVDNPDYFYYKAVSPMSVDEAMILKVKDKSQAESFLENVEAHLESQENVFGGYGTDQMGLLGQAVLGSRGDYVYYFCGDDASAWSDAFLDLIRPNLIRNGVN